MSVNVLTNKSVGIANVIKTPVEITDPISKNHESTLAIWDTGATNCVITKTLAQRLGLKAISRANVSGVHGTKEVDVYFIKIKLNNENITLTTRVTSCDALSSDGKTDILIGMDLITKGDFVISNFNGNTVMSFRVPSLEEVDYVAEVGEHNKFLKTHDAWAKHGNQKCPCGSGKLYHNCHGKSKYNV